MNQLSTYINELLHEADCVIVPGLGAFVAYRVGAMIDAKRGMLLPPRKEVVFNGKLRHDDGLLTDYVARREGVGYAEAAAMVREYAEHVAGQLREPHGAVLIGGVGTLRMTAGGEISFTGDATNDLLTESYGLGVLAVRAVGREAVRVRVPMVGDVRRAAVSAVLLIGLLLVSPSTKIDNQAGYAKADISEMFMSPKAAGAVVEPADNAPRYCLIVASFRTEGEADDYIAAMSRSGVGGLEKVRTSGNGRVRIAAASFASHDEAVRENRRLRRVPGFEKSWILRCDAQ